MSVASTLNCQAPILSGKVRLIRRTSKSMLFLGPANFANDFSKYQINRKFFIVVDVVVNCGSLCALIKISI